MLKNGSFSPKLFAVVAGALLAACSGAGDNLGDSGAVNVSSAAHESAVSVVHGVAHTYRHACEKPGKGLAQCFALVRDEDPTLDRSQPFDDTALTPADLQDAYKIPVNGGKGKTVALVEAWGYSSAETDLAVYRAKYGLPPCTTANGCFKKVNQQGQTTNLPPNPPLMFFGWITETALDLDMVSAGCPSCNILLVEAADQEPTNLGAGNNTAVQIGASAISHSWGIPEGESDPATDDEAYYHHDGVSIFGAAGDGGYGDVEYPATSKYVTAVGGTQLQQAAAGSSGRGWTESAWTSGASGCSTAVAKLPFQPATGCTMRATSDVSAAAEAISTYMGGNWDVQAGTSAATPLVAAIYTATGVAGADNSYAYAHADRFFNITQGNNGQCSNALICTAGPGWNGPTGIGTPNGAALSVH